MGGAQSTEASGGNTSTAKSTGATNNAAVNNNNATVDPAGGIVGMNCTVMDAVSNSKVPFVSSVSSGAPKATSKKSKKKAAAAAAEAAAAENASGEGEAVEDVEMLGDAVVSGPETRSSTTMLTGSAAKYAAAQVADRGDWRSVVGVLNPSIQPTLNRGTVNVGGVLVPGAGVDDVPTGEATPSTTPETAGLRNAPQAKAAIFASKVRYAVPLNFELKTVGGQSAAVRAIAASADGSMFASVFSTGKSAQYFDGNTGALIMEIRAHLDPIVAIAHSRDGKFLLTSSNDGNVCLWDLNNGKKLREVPVTSQANAVAISDDSDNIATSSTEDFVNLWEARNAEALTMFQRHSGAVYCVNFSRRGNLVASGSQNGEVFVWGATAGDVRMHVETGARSAVMHCMFSPDGSRLLTADRDVVQVWDLFTGGLIFSRNGSGDVALGEEGKSLHQPNFVTPPKELPRITCATFAACNTIVIGLTTKKLVVIEPNAGAELLCIDVKALVTCVSTSWSGDILFAGDYSGNHYRLTLRFSHRDVMEFGLNSKPPSKDKGKGAD